MDAQRRFDRPQQIAVNFSHMLPQLNEGMGCAKLIPVGIGPVVKLLCVRCCSGKQRGAKIQHKGSTLAGQCRD
jgi:hypothetical protein